jgi:nucleoside-diphosphate-sugar epimerase
LLTGSAGFLGSRIAKSLLANGVSDLRLLFRQGVPERQIETLRQQFPAARIEPVTGNLLTRSVAPRLLVGVTSVVHAAAGMRGAAADMFLNTVVASRNLLDAVGSAGVRRVTLVSSFSVYRTVEMARGAVLDESAPREDTGIEKGSYAYAKTRQEQLFEEYQRNTNFELVTLRPGVIYGPGGGAFSARVGISAMGRFWSLGGGALLPLTYVENCADAVAVAAQNAQAGATFNVVDDGLPTCREYLRAYRQEVRPMRVMPIPYPVFLLGSALIEWYSNYSKGQLPAVFTPHVVRSMYRPLRYSNDALKSIGWRPVVDVRDGLARTFKALRENP